MTSGRALRAWRVSDINDEPCVLVWAETAGRAKVLALRCSAWFALSDWLDLAVWREPLADGLRDTPQAMSDELNKDDMSLLRKLGWCELEASEAHCQQCGLFEWSLVPESKIDQETLLLEPSPTEYSGL